MMELVGIGEIMKDKKIKKYSVLRREWLNIRRLKDTCQ